MLIYFILSNFFLYLFQEAVADTLEELWISYNNIEKLKGIGVLKKLKVYYFGSIAAFIWISPFFIFFQVGKTILAKVK